MASHMCEATDPDKWWHGLIAACTNRDRMAFSAVLAEAHTCASEGKGRAGVVVVLNVDALPDMEWLEDIHGWLSCGEVLGLMPRSRHASDHLHFVLCASPARCACSWTHKERQRAGGRSSV